MDGFLNLIKPPQMSSGALVAFVKRLTHERVGHAGTLDPEAAGVLPIMVGRATRLLDYFSDHEKKYIAQIAFGASTDTQDAQGRVLERSEHLPDERAIRAVLPRFEGDILQCPPAYSAIKLNGKPLYERARRGELVQTEPRPARIDEIEYMGALSGDAHVLKISCGRGTYIRTLCHDIGAALGCPAHMRFLLRTRSGPFDIREAVTVEEVACAAREGRLGALMMPLDAPLQGLARADVPEDLRKPALNGVALPAAALSVKAGERARVYYDGRLIGIAERRENQLVYLMMLTCAVEFERGL